MTKRKGVSKVKDTYRLVYSSDQPLLCPLCKRKRNKCKCEPEQSDRVVEDSVIRVRREIKGRGGKVVTVITGLPLTQNEMKELLSHFKQLAGCGGTTKNACLELQGDRVSLVIEELARRGFAAKRSGG